VVFLLKIFDDFLNLFFPHKCVLCGAPVYDRSGLLCSKCINEMPKTNFHNDLDNKTAQIFWGRIDLNFAASFLYFYKGSKYRHLIHLLKYNNMPELGVYLGELYGADLIDVNVLKGASYIVPVPLHPKKKRIRGYNQSERFSKGLSDVLGIESKELLVRKIFTETQTKKSREERWLNVKDVFDVVDCKQIENKHIILTDDIVTTGATLEACALALKKCKNVEVSILTLGIAQ
jgi:ComF family protein